MRTVVEVGGWEHECCGPAYERDAVVELRCLVVVDPDGTTRHLESHHDLGAGAVVRGRLADLRVVHRDGTTEAVLRVPSGRALRGFDEEDDGHLEQPWTGEPVRADADRYLLTVLS